MTFVKKMVLNMHQIPWNLVLILHVFPVFDTSPLDERSTLGVGWGLGIFLYAKKFFNFIILLERRRHWLRAGCGGVPAVGAFKSG